MCLMARPRDKEISDLNALTSPPASHPQRSQLNQFANVPEPMHNEIPSNVHECSLQCALHDCSTESLAQNHIDQRMPCLLQDWTCDAGCDVLWTDDESEIELLCDGNFLTACCSVGQQNRTIRGLFFATRTPLQVELKGSPKPLAMTPVVGEGSLGQSTGDGAQEM